MEEGEPCWGSVCAVSLCRGENIGFSNHWDQFVSKQSERHAKSQPKKFPKTGIIIINGGISYPSVPLCLGVVYRGCSLPSTRGLDIVQFAIDSNKMMKVPGYPIIDSGNDGVIIGKALGNGHDLITLKQLTFSRTKSRCSTEKTGKPVNKLFAEMLV